MQYFRLWVHCAPFLSISPKSGHHDFINKHVASVQGWSCRCNRVPKAALRCGCQWKESRGHGMGVLPEPAEEPASRPRGPLGVRCFLKHPKSFYIPCLQVQQLFRVSATLSTVLTRKQLRKRSWGWGTLPTQLDSEALITQVLGYPEGDVHTQGETSTGICKLPVALLSTDDGQCS